MNASLELFFELGLENVERHIESLATEIVRWAQQSDVKLVTPADPARRAGIVCVRPKDANRVSVELTKQGVVHSLREGNIRLSPHIYNTVVEVRRALEAF
jgi:selenocysteine lyase/cysteine desulfurase